MKGRKFWHITFPILRNKFVLTIFIFGVWILLFDQNNLLDRYHDVKKLKQIEQEKDYFINKIDEDQRRIKELESNRDNLEKFAREEYLMKKDDEDVFLVIEGE